MFCALIAINTLLSAGPGRGEDPCSSPHPFALTFGLCRVRPCGDTGAGGAGPISRGGGKGRAGALVAFRHSGATAPRRGRRPHCAGTDGPGRQCAGAPELWFYSKLEHIMNSHQQMGVSFPFSDSAAAEHRSANHPSLQGAFLFLTLTFLLLCCHPTCFIANYS